MKYLYVLLFIIGFNEIFAQNVGIGTPSPHPKALLELSDSTRGFLPPRLTTAQRDTMTNLPKGLIIFNVTTNCLEYWNGTQWISTCASTVPCSPPPAPVPLQDTVKACLGQTATLAVTDLGLTYIWSGPNGFYQTGASVSVTNLTSANFGTYTVYAYNSSTNCASPDTFVVLQETTQPNFSCSTPNSWTNLNPPPTTMYKRNNQVAVQLNGKIYMGLGDTITASLSDWWVYDPCGDGSWQRLADYPGGNRSLTFIFTLNNYIYVGGGMDRSTLTYYSDVYRYDPNTNTWTAVASLPAVRAGAPGASDGTYGYVSCGGNGATYFSDILRYDPNTNTWTTLTNYPAGARWIPFSFLLNNKLYVGTGRTGGAGTETNEFYEYDITTNTWTVKANFPIIAYDGWGIANTANGKGYVFGPHQNTGCQTNYSYDPVSNTWTTISAFPPGNRNNPVGDAMSDGRIYCGFGYDCTTFVRDWWVYCP